MLQEDWRWGEVKGYQDHKLGDGKHHFLQFNQDQEKTYAYNGDNNTEYGKYLEKPRTVNEYEDMPSFYMQLSIQLG